MAILTPSQLTAASNATYFDNTSGSITPTSVRTLNTDWISSSLLVSQTGSMSVASASFAGTASFALNFNPSATASYALQALNADNATLADTATFASTAGSANSANTAVTASNATTAVNAAFATTASFALNFNPAATASYAINASTASFLSGSATSASYAISASSATTAQTASYILNAISASRATSALNADTASFVNLAQTASYVVNAISASYASNAELLDGLNFTAFVLTSSFVPFSSSVSDRFVAAPTLAGNNTFVGNNIFGNVTASNALITSASVINLTVVYETASVIYSSGSNQFGDASNDTQTLWGTVDVKSGPVLVTGSLNVSNGITGSLLGTSSLALANIYTASVSNNIITFTEGDGTTFNLTVATGSGTNTVSASFAATSSFLNALSQSFTITGSVNGNIVSASISSNTSSINFSQGNFFTSLVGSNTFFNITNPKAGQTTNLLLTTSGAATASFSSNVKQVSGSSYLPTAGSGKNDILTFISWDGTSVYLANVKNLI